MGGCIMYTRNRLLLLIIIPLFPHFPFSPNFQTLNILLYLWGLQTWNLDSWWIYCVYPNLKVLLLIHPYISSFFFLFCFQTLKFSSRFSQELWCIESWNFNNTNMKNGSVYRAYWNQDFDTYSSLYSFWFSYFQLLICLSPQIVLLVRISCSLLRQFSHASKSRDIFQ